MLRVKHIKDKNIIIQTKKSVFAENKELSKLPVIKAAKIKK